MRFPLLISLVACAAAPVVLHAAAATPDIAELSFGARFAQPGALTAAGVPAWVTKVEQRGGRFTDDPPSWQVQAGGPQGAGRLEITLNRAKMGRNLVATVLFDSDNEADVAVQLFDAQ